jgi:hypothetical protein
LQIDPFPLEQARFFSLLLGCIVNHGMGIQTIEMLSILVLDNQGVGISG